MNTETRQFEVVIVGAGFAGLYALYKLRSLGFNARVYEAGSDLGGTWYWNRYPGARCDVNSLEYSYQFSGALQQEWNWTERYAPQAEILEYANHVADRFDLRKDIRFDTRVTSLHFDSDKHRWNGETDQGERFQTQFCVMATGCLSKLNMPDFEGLQDFQGELLHTGRWPHREVDFRDRNVAIIGTGSSAIQAIPLIAEVAGSLTVFQRTASYSIPAHNAPMDRDHEQYIKAHYAEFRQGNSGRYAALDNQPSQQSALELDEAARNRVYEHRWQAGGLPFLASFNDLGNNLEANQTAAEFVRRKIQEVVRNPAVAELLCPNTVLGCKRLCVDTDYYRTFNRDNVRLVDVNADPIERITTHGLMTGANTWEFDTLILATGFDAMTGALLDIDIRGRDGITLQEKWQAGPANYLGLTVHGFPNLFTVTGPGSPSVLANMIVAIEQHVDWIADLLIFLRSQSLQSAEATDSAEQKWVKLVNRIANQTLFPNGCNSWYTGANIPGKPRIFMPFLGYPAYVEKCNEVANNDYRGFTLS